MQHLKVSGAVRPLKWSFGVKWLNTKRLIQRGKNTFFDVQNQTPDHPSVTALKPLTLTDRSQEKLKIASGSNPALWLGVMTLVPTYPVAN